MKKYIGILILLCLLAPSTFFAQADRDSTETVVKKIYVITTNSGGEFVGVILKQDAREVLIKTEDKGEVIIPKFEIKEMKELKQGEINAKGDYISEEVFATRYFLTTNGLPMEKGESYVLWNLFGPEIHFGVAKNFSLGIMTTWVGIPIVASAKYNIRISNGVNLGIGALAGSGTWAAPDFGFALPYGALTFGNRRTNLNLSAGYGMAFFDGETSGTTLYSLGGMTPITKKVSFIFDSMFFTYNRVRDNGYYNYNTNSYVYQEVVDQKIGGAFSPGIRIKMKHDAAFQFGFLGAFDDTQFFQVPIPMVGCFKKL